MAGLTWTGRFATTRKRPRIETATAQRTDMRAPPGPWYVIYSSHFNDKQSLRRAHIVPGSGGMRPRAVIHKAILVFSATAILEGNVTR